MAKRVTLTNQGISLLASSSEATGQYYWLGYYALAYVPNLWKNDKVSIPDDCGNVNSDSIGAVEITDTDTDQVTPTMTRLTKYGDMIYNIWQGDLNGTGYIGCNSDGSAGGDLFALTLYNTNVKKHYRYVLDKNGNNTLVGWIEDPSYSDGTMLGKHVFKGTDGYFSSTLPIPAPVYYLGDVTGKVSVDSFFNELPTFEDTSGYSGNGADLYPFITVTLKSHETLDIPRVSADYRGYTDSQGNPGTFNYGGSAPFDTPITAHGTYFDTTEIPYPLSSQFDETSWFAADQTFNISGITDTDAIFGEEFWKLHTISNYNRYHAPVDSIGHVLNSDLSNRNMAKTTKFFPISNYKVINSESGFTSNSEMVEVATAIKLSIDVDITPRTLTGDDSETSNIEFFEKYGNPQDTVVVDEYGNNIYNSTHTSFKFNRIGIYAVPLRKAPYVQDQGFGTASNGENVKLEFQINPDDEPVLFAVLDWDNTISMSDTGDGINQFRAEVDVNLESPIGVDDTALLRNTTIFYNMYEDDALHWYQNQLIATASTSNAITEIGLEVAHIRNSVGDSKCCPSPDLSNKYAPLNHSHDFLRNLKDGNDSLENGLKGIITAQEGPKIDGQSYKLGNASMVLGENTAVLSDRSIIGNGFENHILDDSDESAILTGYQNYILSNSSRSVILGGQENIIDIYAPRSLIGVGSINTIKYAEDSTILSAVDSSIEGSNQSELVSKSLIGAGIYNRLGGLMSSSAIAAGINNYIIRGNFGFIGAGNANSITESSSIFIGSGTNNSVSGGSSTSFIGSGEDNSITDSAYAFSGAGLANVNNGSDFGFIGAGGSHLLAVDSDYSGIVTGKSNYIGVNARYHIIGGGQRNGIWSVGLEPDYTQRGIIASMIGSGADNRVECSFGMIGAGTNNRLDYTSTFGMIGAGSHNYIGINGAYSFIGAGVNNTTVSVYAGIVSGEYNYIGTKSAYSFIGAGLNNYIGSNIDGDVFESEATFASIIGGRDNKILADGNFSTVLGGRYAVLDKKCEVGFSAGAFMSDDETPVVLAYNKNSKLMLRGVTTVANPTINLSFENDGSQDFQIKRGEGFSGTINIMGYMQNVFTPDSCTLNDYRTMDVVYNELHSISGVYTKDVITDAVQTTAISGLSYNEYDRYNKNAVTDSGYNIDPINITGFTSAATPGVTSPVTVTVTAAGGHGLVANDTIVVWGSSDPAYNVLAATPIVYVSSTIFTYQVLGPISDQNPTNSGTPGTFPTVNKIYYGPREIEHAPSIVDTVLDYRYTMNPGNNCQFGSAISDWVQSGYPKISMGVGVGGTGDTIAFLVDANPLHTVEQYVGEDPYVLVDSPIYWVATLDLTWIQLQ